LCKNPSGFSNPVTFPVSKPVIKPVAKPVTKPIAKPLSQQGVKPIAKPVAKPVVKPIAVPVKSAELPKPVHTKPFEKPSRYIKPATSSGNIYFTIIY
jgi:hypothetical protein